MKESVLHKLESLIERFDEVQALLSEPDVINDQNKFRGLSKEYAQLEELVKCFREYRQAQQELENAREMQQESDAEIREMAEEEAKLAKETLSALESELQILLLPKDPKDDLNCFIEIRAGAGGDEAAIFAGDLFRMYSRYAEHKGWRVELVSASEGEHGGYKEVIANMVGDGCYGILKFESGGHRVQRVPETESQGRIHTSACTVAILAEAEDIDHVDINSNDLRIDTYRASGAGGQHVNKTDSAVRITHLSSGIVVECQDERSQHKNKARAMSLLQAKLLSTAQQEQTTEQAEARKLQVGSGDRSERIRTYNFPQNRLTDHRINLTLYKLDEIIQGELNQVVNPLVQEHQAEQLTSLASDEF